MCRWYSGVWWLWANTGSLVAPPSCSLDSFSGFSKVDSFQMLCCIYHISIRSRSVSVTNNHIKALSHHFVTVPIRLAFFWVSNYIANLVSAFLAVGILRLRGVGGQAGWRYLFLIEGCLTLGVGLASWFLMPPGPTQTKAWFRPKGWFTDR